MGLDDNFFELGGDSIVSIQLVSRARRAGLSITPRAVFQHQTVEALAAVASAAADPASALPAVDVASLASGSLPATPIMRWLKERGGPLDRFSQSMLLRVPGGLLEDDLRAALQAVLDHHDALRLRLTMVSQDMGASQDIGASQDMGASEHDDWRLEIAPAGAVAAGACLRRIDAGAVDDAGLRELIAEAAEAAEQRLRPCGRRDGAGGVVRCRRRAPGASAAHDPSSGGGWGVVADPGAGSGFGLAGDRGRQGDRAAGRGGRRSGAGRSGLRRMRGMRALPRSFRSGAGCRASLRCCWWRIGSIRPATRLAAPDI